MHGTPRESPTPPEIRTTGYCPRCGHDQRGTLAAGMQRCPECGWRYGRADLRPAPPPSFPWLILSALASVLPRTLAEFVAIFFTMAICLVAVLPSAAGGTRCGRRLSIQYELPRLHDRAVDRAESEAGAYPVHIARLIDDDGRILDMCYDSRAGDWDPQFLVGSYDLVNYDWTPAAAKELDEAITALDAARPWYRFGDVSFARLDRPRDDALLVFAWSLIQRDGARWVVFDDGHVESVTEENWNWLWLMDSYARLAHGLSPIDPPPWRPPR